MDKKEFPPLINDRIIKIAWGIPGEYKTPVWIMRQAGRYLPEFRELRKEHDFFKICKTPELACEATLMPIKRFDLDAAIIFSDILVIPEALGMKIEMQPGVGPVFTEPLLVEHVKKLKTNNVIDRLKYVGEAITLTRHKLDGKCPLFGFCGSPWTLMSYMIEGGGSKTCNKAKKWLYVHDILSNELLSLLTDIIVDYLVMQVKSGAQILQIFDSNAEYLNPRQYRQFSVPYLKRICEDIKLKLNNLKLEPVPLVIFAKGAYHSLSQLADCGFQVISLDWVMDANIVNTFLDGKNITLQGNLDPCALYATKENLVNAINDMMKTMEGKRLIVNLGHGIYPDIDPEAVEIFIDTVHQYSLLI